MVFCCDHRGATRPEAVISVDGTQIADITASYVASHRQSQSRCTDVEAHFGLLLRFIGLSCQDKEKWRKIEG